MRILTESLYIICQLLYLIIICVPITIILLIFINIFELLKNFKLWISGQRTSN